MPKSRKKSPYRHVIIKNKNIIFIKLLGLTLQVMQVMQLKMSLLVLNQVL